MLHIRHPGLDAPTTPSSVRKMGQAMAGNLSGGWRLHVGQRSGLSSSGRMAGARCKKVLGLIFTRLAKIIWFVGCKFVKMYGGWFGRFIWFVGCKFVMRHGGWFGRFIFVFVHCICERKAGTYGERTGEMVEHHAVATCRLKTGDVSASVGCTTLSNAKKTHHHEL